LSESLAFYWYIFVCREREREREPNLHLLNNESEDNKTFKEMRNIKVNGVG
jgi:hypothetical protein